MDRLGEVALHLGGNEITRLDQVAQPAAEPLKLGGERLSGEAVEVQDPPRRLEAHQDVARSFREELDRPQQVGTAERIEEGGCRIPQAPEGAFAPGSHRLQVTALELRPDRSHRRRMVAPFRVEGSGSVSWEAGEEARGPVQRLGVGVHGGDLALGRGRHRRGGLRRWGSVNSFRRLTAGDEHCQ